MIALLCEDMRVGAAIGVFVVITLLVQARLRNLAVPHWQRSREASARFIWLCQRTPGRHRRHPRKQCTRIYTFPLPSAPAHFLADNDTGGVAGLLDDQCRLVSLLGQGCHRIWRRRVYFFSGALTIGTIYLIFRYTNLISQPIEQIARESEQLQLGGAGIVCIQGMFATESLLVETPAAAGKRDSPQGSNSAGSAGALTSDPASHYHRLLQMGIEDMDAEELDRLRSSGSVRRFRWLAPGEA